MTVGALRLLFVTAVWTACFPLIINGLDLAPHLVFAALRVAHAGLCLIALGYLCRLPVPVLPKNPLTHSAVGHGRLFRALRMPTEFNGM